MKKICLIEDEVSLYELIKVNLELESYYVEIITHGSEAFLRARDMDEFDLVILDVMLPEVSGLSICREIRKFTKTPILFLSAKGSTEDRIAGLKLGANDYLPKPFDLEELLLRVQVLIDGVENSIELPQKVIIGNFEVDFNTFVVTNIETGTTQSISKREIDLLKFFNDRLGLVVSREEILDNLWGVNQYPTARTIDNYILNFRKIFEDDPKKPRFFHSIRGVGYKFTI